MEKKIQVIADSDVEKFEDKVNTLIENPLWYITQIGTRRVSTHGRVSTHDEYYAVVEKKDDHNPIGLKPM